MSYTHTITHWCDAEGCGARVEQAINVAAGTAFYHPHPLDGWIHLEGRLYCPAHTVRVIVEKREPRG